FFLLKNKPNKKIGFPIALAVGTILKAVFMGVIISLIVVPTFLPDKMSAMLTTIQITFSFTQLITAAIGSVLAYILFIPISKSIKM
ncbi:MAG: ECF transporter S component, partial [Clostridia bacterium]|nr:ECF transporter S component [Clostridia bacterium]